MPALQHDDSCRGDRQVLVVGTGLAGLLTAVACRERGFDPLVTGGSAPGRDRTLTLWRPAMTLLEKLGVADALAAGTPVRRWVWRHPRGTADEIHVHDGDPEDTPCLRVRRSRVERALAATVPDSRLRADRTLRRVEAGRSGPVVTFADGVRERFDLVVGADGPDSRVRDAAADTTGEDGDAVVTRSTAEASRPPRLQARDTVYERWAPGGPVVRLGPLEGADVWRYVGRDTGDHTVGTERWTGGGVALVGDAAHPLTPVLTTGDSLAVEDGTTLAAVLASRPTIRAALRTYERRRTNRLDGLYGACREDSGKSDTLAACRRTFFGSVFDRRVSPGDTGDC